VASATIELLVRLTSVSETTEKLPLAEPQTALGKQEKRSVEHGYLSHCRNSEKNCFSTQNFTEIGHWLLSYGQKRFSIWRLSAILNFKYFHIWSLHCHRVPNLLLCTKFH